MKLQVREHLSHLRRTDDRVGGGFVVVEFISELAARINVVRQSHQTFTYYNFVKTEVEDFAKALLARAAAHVSPELKGANTA